MAKEPLDSIKIHKIRSLRLRGCSVKEIRAHLGHSVATISKYIQGVSISEKYKSILENKRFPSKKRSQSQWEFAERESFKIIGTLNKRDRILLLIGLYWGEGTKRELNIINGDPALLKVFVTCIQDIGITKDMLKMSLRLYENISPTKAIAFWANNLGVSERSISSIQIVPGNKIGKLEYGMCRIRVKKSSSYFKLLMSMIALLKDQVK